MPLSAQNTRGAPLQYTLRLTAHCQLHAAGTMDISLTEQTGIGITSKVLLSSDIMPRVTQHGKCNGDATHAICVPDRRRAVASIASRAQSRQVYDTIIEHAGTLYRTSTR